MKSNKFYLTLIFLIFSIPFLSTHCDKDNGTSSKDDLVGTWEMIKIKMSDNGSSATSEGESIGWTMKIVFEADGAYTNVTTLEEGIIVTETGQWFVSGDRLTMDSDKPDEETETATYTLDSNTLILRQTFIEDGHEILVEITLIKT